MCYRMTCQDCRRPTWGGCGRHVEVVLRDVALGDRCVCRRGVVKTSRPTVQPITEDDGDDGDDDEAVDDV